MPPAVDVNLLAFHSAATSRRAIAAALADGYAGDVRVWVREQGGDASEAAALSGLGERVHVESGPNLGFCGGHNRLLGLGHAEIVVLLNADAWMAPHFLDAVVDAFTDPAVGAVQPLVVDHSGQRIDTTGLTIDRARRVVNRRAGRPVGEVPATGEVWGVDGAVAALRRSALDDIAINGEVLPESFGSYKEDVDLSWRLRSAGWKIWFAPDAVAHHDRTSVEHDATALARWRQRRRRSVTADRNGFANQRWARVANERAGDALRDAPVWLPRELASLVAAPFGPGGIRSVIRLARGLPAARRRRRAVQARRRVSDDRRWLG